VPAPDREDPGAAIRDRTFRPSPLFSKTLNWTMLQVPANDLDRRRAAARRTAWIVAGVAFAIFVLFFIQAVSTHR